MPKMTPHALSLAVLPRVETKTSSSRSSSFPPFASTMIIVVVFRRRFSVFVYGVLAFARLFFYEVKKGWKEREEEIDLYSLIRV